MKKLYHFLVTSYDIYSYSDPTDSCLRSFPSDVCLTPPTYFPGLGGPYHSCCELWFTRYCYELIYYKKGDTEWGTPYNLPVFEYKNNNVFSVYPNPTTGQLRIESNKGINPLVIEVFDVYGRNVGANLRVCPCVRPCVCPVENKIDISHLQPGIYFLKITTDKGIVTKKVIKN